MSAKRGKGGKAPAWVITFADLVTVVLAFFVLMLSFSATDPIQYHRVSDSMATAFADDLGGIFDRVSLARLGIPLARIQAPQGIELPAPPFARQAEGTYERVRATLHPEIESGMIRLERTAQAVVIRFSDLAFFSPGSERVTPSFGAVIARISALLGETEGTIVIQGHTDDIPISTSRFRSNWELSTARAVSVAHELLNSSAIEQTRVVVQGHADSRPIVSNDSPQHRAQNRRVEIHISTGP